jgi:hypothetical protein
MVLLKIAKALDRSYCIRRQNKEWLLFGPIRSREILLYLKENNTAVK